MQLSIAALTLPLVIGNPQVIIPFGTFDAEGGSLKGTGPWNLSDSDGYALVNKANSGIDIVIDYEHQTLLAQENGRPAPASGWIIAGGLSWQPGIGVVANSIRWTPDAAEMIKTGAYRFLSPVFSYSQDGVPKALLSVALTNTPALTTLQELAIAANNRGLTMSEETRNQSESSSADTDDSSKKKSNDKLNRGMKKIVERTLSKFIEGISHVIPTSPPTTAASPPVMSPVTPVAALSAPNAQATASTTVPLSVTQHPMIAALTNQVTLLGADNARLREELMSLQRQLTDSAKNSLITAALSVGKLMPGMEAWAQSMSIEELSNYLNGAQPIAALTSTQTKGVAPKTSANSDAGDLNEDEIAICKQFNIPHERFISQRVSIKKGIN
jgi:phage I-like protein